MQTPQPTQPTRDRSVLTRVYGGVCRRTPGTGDKKRPKQGAGGVHRDTVVDTARPKRGRVQPPVLVVGSTGRLVSLKAVSVELGLSDRMTRTLLERLGVALRRIGSVEYVMLFQLERALWRWYGLSDDLYVFQMAHLVYRDMEQRGVERHLKRMGLRETASRLKKRALVIRNLDAMARTSHMKERRNGRPARGARWLQDEIERLNAVPERGPSMRADPALKIIRQMQDEDLPPPDGEV